ncbi:MAG: hypothetical protein ACRYFX_11375 [Janthinobacterium lividum]
MCPPLSCCHGRSTSPLSVPLYHLLRLQLASATQRELPAVEPPRLRARQHALWQALHQAIETHHCTGPARAREMVEQLLMSLLLEECCRHSLRQAVSLAEAMGAVVGRSDFLDASGQFGR